MIIVAVNLRQRSIIVRLDIQCQPFPHRRWRGFRCHFSICLSRFFFTSMFNLLRIMCTHYLEYWLSSSLGYDFLWCLFMIRQIIFGIEWYLAAREGYLWMKACGEANLCHKSQHEITYNRKWKLKGPTHTLFTWKHKYALTEARPSPILASVKNR